MNKWWSFKSIKTLKSKLMDNYNVVAKQIITKYIKIVILNYIQL